MSETSENTKALERLTTKMDRLDETMTSVLIEIAKLKERSGIQDKLIYGAIGVIITLVLNSVLKGLVL